LETLEQQILAAAAGDCKEMLEQAQAVLAAQASSSSHT